jgi:hypothetical protein
MAAFFVRATISVMVLLSPSNLLIDCVCVCLLPPSRSVYPVASEDSSRARSLDHGPALHPHPRTQARPIQSLARCPELGSPKKGLGADDQIGDHARCGRPRELRSVPLGRTVSHGLLLPCGTAYRTILFFFFRRYRTTVDRLLGMKLVPSRRLVRRNVSYDFMNRQMVWHAFTVCPTYIDIHMSMHVEPADRRDRNSSCSSFPSFLTVNSDVPPGWQ